MSTVIFELLLIFHFSLIFSLTLLCTILYVKTRDSYIFSFLKLLYPLFTYLLIVIGYYLFRDTFNTLFVSDASLFLLVFVSVLIPLVLYGTTTYLLSLIDISERHQMLSRRITYLFSLMFFLFSLFFIIYLNGEDWEIALGKAINELFLFGSLFLLIPAFIATLYLKRSNKKEHRRMLIAIMVSFYPMILYGILDYLFFLHTPYKLIYISYFIFSLQIYLFIFRNYVHTYEPERPFLADDILRFYSESHISEREQEIIGLLIEGKTNREIADELFISYNTVKTHIRNVYKKLEVSSKLQLVYRIRNHPNG